MHQIIIITDRTLTERSSDRTIVIKEADKGSGVVVWDREDYIMEAESQLGDPAVYLPLGNDPSNTLHNVIDHAMGRIRQRGDVDDKTLEYLMVNNPKLGRFYLLPKIHKRLNSVPGRPVISNSGFHTENFSEFWTFIYNPCQKVFAPISRTQIIPCKRYNP